VIRLFALVGLLASLFSFAAYNPPAVDASGNCNIVSVVVDGPGSNNGHEYCYGNNFTYGDLDMSSENQSGLHGPLDNGTLLHDYDTTAANSGITTLIWWQRTDGEFKMCFWDAINQPDAQALYAVSTKSGSAALSSFTKISSFRIITAGYSCSNHPN